MCGASLWGALGAACSSVCHPLLLPADFIRVVRSFEATRQWCSWLEKDGQRAREQLARAEAERAALEVKLKHARNQVEVEMKKRHRAEAELEKDIGRTLKALIRSTRPEVGEELGGKRIDLGGGSKRIWGWLYTVYSALQACSTHGCCPFCLQHSLH